MRHGLVAGVAALAIALATGALLAAWEKGPPPNEAGLPNTAVQEGRAATGTDPANPPTDYGNH